MKEILQPIDLVGETLSTVAFTQDYIELNFDGAFLRFFSHPSIKTDGFDGKFPDVKSRDAFCSLIGRKLFSLQFDDKKELVLVFESMDKVVFPLGGSCRNLWKNTLHFKGNIDKVTRKKLAEAEREKEMHSQMADAWSKRDYSTVVEISSCINEVNLSQAENIKINYARKRLSEHK